MTAKPVIIRTPTYAGPAADGVTYYRPVELEYVIPEHVSGIVHEPENPGLHVEWQRRSPDGLEYGPRIKLLTLHVGPRTLYHVQGPLGDLHRRLFGTSPDAAPTGVSVKVLSGSYALAGDGDDGEATVEAGSSVVLDPDRLTAASGEWTLTRPPSSPRNRYELVIGPAPTFTLQRRVPPDEPDGEARWDDVTETLNLQATARLRPKPVG